ncbi:hypothetical protein EI94DRAFT_1565996, partial [Lactarius quietus]
LGHLILNIYLHRFKRKDSNQCSACRVPKETHQHFLMECPAHTHERWELQLKKGRKEINFMEVLMSKSTIVMLAHFIQSTGRFTVVEQTTERPVQQVKVPK